MRTRLWISEALVGAALLCPCSAVAEELSWESCVTEVSRNNADLEVSRQNLRAAEYQYRAAYSGFLPQVSGNYSYAHTNASGIGGVQGTGSSSNNYASATLDATENLFSGFQDRGKIDQAAANREVVEASLDATRAKVTFDLTSAYAGLSYAQNSVELSNEIVKRRDANLQLVQMNFEGGRENRGSYLLSEANLNQSRFESLQARGAVDVAGQALAKALGRPEGVGLRVSGQVPISAPGTAPDIERLVPLTPEHRQAVAQERVNKALVTQARSQFYPSLTANGSWGKQGNEFFPEDSRWNVGFTFSIPIFNGGRDYFGSKAAVANLASALSNEQSVNRQSRLNLRQTWTAYVEAVEKLKVDEGFVQAATVRADIARRKYNNGLLSFEDWDIIENDLIAREKTVLQSRRGRTIAEAAWNQAQGKGVIP
ncbi:MAG: TolC family protein [Pseudomonadota bacterium]